MVAKYSNTNPFVCDMVAFDFVYGTNDNTDGANNWNTEGLYANDNMTTGAGYFVWPFNENTNNESLPYDISYVTKVESSLLTATPSQNQYSVTNYGVTLSGNVNTGYWFVLGNPFNKALAKADIINIGNVSSATYSCVYIDNNGTPQPVQGQGHEVYVWDAYSQEWNSEIDSIFPGQGFVVMASESGKNVKFNMVYPTTSNNPLPARKNTEDYNEGITFTLTANGTKSNFYAKQMSDAQDGFDIKDAYVMFSTNENKVEPYFVVENNAVKYNRYNSDNYACEINFHAQKSGVAQLSVSDVPEGTTVSIVDLAMNEETVLDGEPYQIDIEAGENAGRYQIKINKSSVSLPQTMENKTNISIWNNNKEVFVKGENLQRVEVYNTIGQKVYQREISGDTYNFTFDNEGAYIVKVTSENGTKSHKIVIR